MRAALQLHMALTEAKTGLSYQSRHYGLCERLAQALNSFRNQLADDER